MRELHSVLGAFYELTGCAAAVWAADPDGVQLLAAGGPTPARPEDLPDSTDVVSESFGARVLTTRLGGSKRVWLSVGPCANEGASAEQHLRLLTPVVSHFVRGALEVEHATEELAERYEEINLLYAISEILGRTTSVEEAAAAILTELTQTVDARRAAILVYDKEANLLRPVAAIGAQASFLPPIPVTDLGSVSARVFRTRHASIVDAEQVTSSAEATYVRGAALLCVPILWTRPGATSQPLGIVTLSDRDSDTTFSAGDQKLVTAIATQIGTAIQNARLVRASMEQQRLQQEMSLAHDLQMKLLPDPATIDGVNAGARVVPAESVGGDFYNLFTLGNSATGLIVGDVSSHGYRAALIMALVMSASAIQAQIHADPGAMLGALLRSLRDELATTEMHISVFYAVIDRGDSRLVYANSGHPHAFVFDGDSDGKRLPASNPPIGLSDDEPKSASCAWKPGEATLVVFTDGISDARGPKGERFGEQRVLDLVKRNRGEQPKAIVDMVFESLKRFTGGAAPRDDQTLVVLRT